MSDNRNFQLEPESALASLPTDVLQALCRAVQLDAVTTQQLREGLEMSRKLKMLDQLSDLIPKPAFLALRLCCKGLRGANDSVRTSIRFHAGDMEEVEPYLRKLPNLTTLILECEEEDGCLDDALCVLHSIVPRLECLTIRHESPQPSPSHNPCDGQGTPATYADLHINTLLPWKLSLRHLELRSIMCHPDDHGGTVEPEDGFRLRTGCDNLSFLSSFPALQSLHLDRIAPPLTSRDLSSCTALQRLHLRTPRPDPDDPIRVQLDLSACPHLQQLTCKGCEVVKLDISACPLLESLEASDNDIKFLDLSSNPLLKVLLFDGNRIRKLNLTCCPLLETVDLENNPLRDLQIEGCSRLKSLAVNQTNLSDLDVSRFSELERLLCDTSPIAQMIVAGCSRIESLDLSNMGDIVSVDLTGLARLTQLRCSLGSVTSLVLDGCKALEYLYLKNALELASLDLSSCPLLREAQDAAFW
ncbi:MAG: hypothetical protein WDW36_005426 [Sanguina aurantia]